MRVHACCFFSHVGLFVTLWTIALQAPLSMGFSRQECWSGLPCPPPGDLPDPGTEPLSLMSPALTGGFFTTSATWEAPSPIPFLQLSTSGSLVPESPPLLIFCPLSQFTHSVPSYTISLVIIHKCDISTSSLIFLTLSPIVYLTLSEPQSIILCSKLSHQLM